jgi:hypothetical protein
MVFMPVREIVRTKPEVLSLLTVLGGGPPPTVMRGVPPEEHIQASDTYWCDACAALAEREAARGPSFAIVEIKRGPKNPTPQVRV